MVIIELYAYNLLPNLQEFFLHVHWGIMLYAQKLSSSQIYWPYHISAQSYPLLFFFIVKTVTWYRR